MFERQFGLRENPFAAGHQSRFVYPSREHQEALAHLRYGIENREPFVLITGEVGTGKTTALYDVLGEWQSRAVVAMVTNSALTRAELLEEISVRFGSGVTPGSSKPQMLVQLERHLLAVRAQGLRAILILDEAQNLDRELLEEVRLLSNLESQGDKLLQIFLVGQPELEAILTRPELRQLRQRIAVHYRLHPLSEDDTERYIHHRLTVAGGHAISIFPADACREVYRLTHGIPREINTVAAQSMLNAFVEDSPVVLIAHVLAVESETEFQSVARGPEPASDAAPAPVEHAAAAAARTDAPRASEAAAPPPTFAPPTSAFAPPTGPPPLIPTMTPPPPSAWPLSPPARSPREAEPTSHTGIVDTSGARADASVRPAASTAAWEAWRASFAQDVGRVAEEPLDDDDGANDPRARTTHGTPPIDAPHARETTAPAPHRSEPLISDDPAELGYAAHSRDEIEAEAAAEPAYETTRRWDPVEVAPPSTDTEFAAALQHAEQVAAGATHQGTARRHVDVEPPPALRRPLEFEDATPTGSGNAMRWVMIGAGALVVAAGTWFGVQVMQSRSGPETTTTASIEPQATAKPAATAPATPPQRAATSPAPPATPAPGAGETREPAPTAPPAVERGGARATSAAATPSRIEPAPVAQKPATTASEPTAPPAAPPAVASAPPAAEAKPAAVKPAETKPAEPKPAAAKPATPKPAAAAEPARVWGIGVATFLAEERAAKERDKLASSTGLPGRVTEVREGGDVSYRVVLGAFPDRAAAENAASALIDKGLIDMARVTSYAPPGR